MKAGFYASKWYLALTMALVGFSLTACSGSISPRQPSPSAIPDEWLQQTAEKNQIENEWLKQFNDQQLDNFINEALASNYSLAEQKARVEESRQGIIVSGAERMPALSLGLDASRSKTIVQSGAAEISENYQLGVDISWELDIWGKLNDTQRQAHLEFQAQQAQLVVLKQQLAANIATQWYNLLAADQLTRLFQHRLVNLQQDLDIINNGYQQGINSALDVYLARTTVAQEQAQIAQQQQLLLEAKTSLQLLLGRRPGQPLPIDKKLPVLQSSIPTGLPSQLISRRPDLQKAWLELLAIDLELAVAHKNRFPSIKLTASSSDSADTLRELLNGSSLGWSLLGGLTQPLFEGGRLKAREKQAKSRVKQAEKRYLDQVYRAFAEVENAINQQNSLIDRYQAFLTAEKDSQAAQELSSDQYQHGLVTYTTVLGAQRRSFDAQSTVLELRNQLLQNRIALYLALGGNFLQRTTGEL